MACRCCIVSCICCAVLLLITLTVLFVVIPVIFMFSLEMQRMLVFPTYLIDPQNYSDPEQYGITGVRNMYITVPYSDGNITIGLWQILPKEMVSDILRNDEYNFDGLISNKKYHILLYLHGNGSDRSNFINLYEILREYFHIFAIDYRGYGDSNGGNLTETNIVNDIVYIYKWLREQTKSKIFIWGHSLGTGIATHTITNLKKNKIVPSGLILEAPFTSVAEVVKINPLVKFYSFLPWHSATIVEPFISNDLNFDSKSYITDIDCPIMILHAKDDDDIPFKLASTLYYVAANNRNYTYQGNLTYHLQEPHGYGHMNLYQDPDLPRKIEIFIEECISFEGNSSKS
ncbi:hypothetical protein ABEB36_000465 [Hypothenemus hampei]|uniref:Serine aminopeptidase S33 domain-containing protein n=1 Tax=Hypothenemus hampei TaxID=57062 RepID=A0ABD1FD78_HYPHA